MMEAEQVQERVGVWFEFVESVNCHLRVYAFCQGGIIYRTNKFWFIDISLCEAVSQWFCPLLAQRTDILQDLAVMILLLRGEMKA